MNRVLLVGGAGTVGSHTADHLLADETLDLSEIRIFDNFTGGARANLSSALADPRVRIIEGDIRDKHAIGKAMSGVDAAFHLVPAGLRMSHDDPRLVHDVLANGTFNVFEAAAQAGLRRIVLASSASIYGLADRFPTPESDHAYNGSTVHGAVMAYGEGLARSFRESHGLDCIALRYFNVFGPRMETDPERAGLLVGWIRAISAGNKPIVPGDGSQTVDCIYVGDVARANVLALSTPLTNMVFNVARGEELTLLHLAELVAKVMRSKVRPVCDPSISTGMPATRQWADITQARRMLGFRAGVPLEVGLMNLVKWWRADERVAGRVVRAKRGSRVTRASGDGAASLQSEESVVKPQ